MGWWENPSSPVGVDGPSPSADSLPVSGPTSSSSGPCLRCCSCPCWAMLHGYPGPGEKDLTFPEHQDFLSNSSLTTLATLAPASTPYSLPLTSPRVSLHTESQHPGWKGEKAYHTAPPKAAQSSLGPGSLQPPGPPLGMLPVQSTVCREEGTFA